MTGEDVPQPRAPGTESLKVLILGNGGREHALLWKLRRDAPDAEFFFTGRNAGMEELAEPLEVEPSAVGSLLELARRRAIDLTVVGPEAPLAAGIVDAFAEAELSVFGPRRAAAEIECSKAFAKRFMLRHGIPTAAFRTFTDADAAEGYLRGGTGGVVVKASGLAGGKGAIVCETREQALEVADAMLRRGDYGAAGREVVVEERLCGPELSVIALTDGEVLRPLIPARDHKRVQDGDRGPNTGGMGAIAPVPGVSASLLEEIVQQALRPAVRGLAAEGRPFRGALYVGLILTRDGPQVVEFNARFGDPETQALVPLMDSSLLDLLRACAEPGPRGLSLGEVELRWREAAACCVVAASGGYPAAYERGVPITLGDGGIGAPADEAELELTRAGREGEASGESALVFHAGTAHDGGRLVTAGGRVLAVTGLGPDHEAARAAAYGRLGRISFPGMHYRTDIGLAASSAPGTCVNAPRP